MAANPLDCPVCLNRYDCDCRSPRCLCCGHTLCSKCIGLLLSTGRLTCPICRSAHTPNVGELIQVPINYTVLTLVEGASSNARPNLEMSEFSRSKQNLQDASLIHRYRCRDQIEKLSLKKKAFEINQQMLQSKLREVEEVQLGICSALANGDDHCQTLDVIMENAASSESHEQLESASKQAERCQNDIKLWVQTTQLLLNLGDSADGELSLSKLAIKVSKSKIGVWAKFNIQNIEDRWAQMSLCEGRLLLGSLKADTPPPEAEILSYQQVRLLIDNTNVTTFLRIKLPDSAQSNIVCIRLRGNEDRTRQFQLMCSGERGPSYAATYLHDRQTDVTKGVWGGARNDGEVGALSGFEMGPPNELPIVEGLVASFYMYPVERRPTHFLIYLQNKEGYIEMSPIGQVISGLPIIKEAHKVENISDVRITDCGIVLQDIF